VERIYKLIIFDLKCENDHKFDGWFKNREAFAEQKSQNLITCPICNSPGIDIIPSSLTILGKDSRAASKSGGNAELSPIKALQTLYQYIDKNFEDVGNKFAEVALKIHFGDEEKRNIKGTTTPQEDDSLREEGVQFIKIPVPKMDS
jgi:hypothetical protein